MNDTTAQSTSAGIEALIDRLRREGVDEGRAEAEKIVAEAESRARSLLDTASQRATARLEEAEAEAAKLKRAGEDALRIAMRDALLELKEAFSVQFARQVEGMIVKAMQDEELLKRMILEVAGRAREEAAVDAAREVEVVLPRTLVSLDELRRKPEELREGSLTQFVVATAGDLLRSGLTYTRSDDDSEGIRLVLTEEGLVVDLTDTAVASVILRHLQPRFRALLESVVY